jgi:hypothetical protein
MNNHEVLKAVKDLPKNWNGYYGATFTDEDILFFTLEHCNKSFEGNFAENINDAIRECMVFEQLYSQSISEVVKYE